MTGSAIVFAVQRGRVCDRLHSVRHALALQACSACWNRAEMFTVRLRLSRDDFRTGALNLIRVGQPVTASTWPLSW
jgi:hypothetical protein